MEALPESGPRYPALAAGPVFAALVYWLLPDAYTSIDGVETAITFETKATVAMLAWMATWWFTEAVHLAVTAMLPLALFPLFGIADVKTTASSYASHLIFLFAGGFIIGLAIHRWRLDKRIALLVLLAVGERPANVVAGFMLVAAFLSAFVSNTATTIMLLPIALSLLDLRDADRTAPSARSDNFTVCLLIAIAYSASIGGISTLVGTAPNVFTASFIQNSLPEQFRTEISFVGWAKMALPVTLTLLPACWLLLTRFVFPLGDKLPGAGRGVVRVQYRELGAVRRGEWITLGVFASAATLWVTRPLLNAVELEIAGAGLRAVRRRFRRGYCDILRVVVVPVARGRRTRGDGLEDRGAVAVGHPVAARRRLRVGGGGQEPRGSTACSVRRSRALNSCRTSRSSCWWLR